MADGAATPVADATASPTPTPASVVPLDAARQRRSATTASTDSTIVTDGLTRAMYIPAVLQTTGPKNKHLLGALGKKQRGENGEEGGRSKGSGGGGPGGKRKRRRWENAQLAGNPHLHRPTRADFAPGPYLKGLSTTFAPPPAAFSRSTYISSSPSSSPTAADLASSSEAGQFSLSLRGLRKNLRTAIGSRRGAGGPTEEALEVMERELVAWLTLSGRIPEGFYHDSAAMGARGGKVLDPTPLEDFPSAPVPSLPDLPSSSSSASSAPPPPTLTELSRQPHTLVWLAPSPHHRYLLHALARYYSLQSFSRPLSPLESDLRVTHILRPQLVRPRVAAATLSAAGGAFETPPGTDWSTAGGTTTEGELTAGESSAYETDTDAGSVAGGEEWDRVSAGSVPSAVAGGTDDEAEAVYSTESDSATGEDSEYDGEGGVDSLASSFADLSAGEAPSRPAAPSSALSSGAATPSRPSSSPFISLSASTPVPSFRLSPSSTPHASSSSAADATPTRRSAARGRRSLPSPLVGAGAGYDSPAESSPSRSRDRDGPARGAFAGVPAGEWRMPERGFLDWVLS
ncbi:hypothetical protein JCM6882_007699 [Rhodosporidiobolus microsporus]